MSMKARIDTFPLPIRFPLGGRMRSKHLALVLGVLIAAAVSSPAWAESEDLGDFLERVCAGAFADEEGYEVTAQLCGMEVRSIRIEVPAVEGGSERLVAFETLVADESDERFAGYQLIGGRVVERTRILFVFEREVAGAFHMCNVSSPLDIAWVRSNGSILDIRSMQPGRGRPALGCPYLYAPRAFGGYRFALEVPPGFFEAHGIDREQARFVVEPWMTSQTDESPS